MSSERDKEPFLADLRRLSDELPETSEANSWGHPNFKAGKRTYAAYEWKRGRPAVAFKVDPIDYQWLEQEPDFFTSRGWGLLFVDALEKEQWPMVRDLLIRSYRSVALKRMLDALAS